MMMVVIGVYLMGWMDGCLVLWVGFEYILVGGYFIDEPLLKYKEHT
jgi:hypothetical protein